MSDIGSILLGIVAWLGAFVAPPLMARWCWYRAPRRFGVWIPPLAFVPCVLAIDWLFLRIIQFAAHDEGQGSPGLGIALVPPLVVLLASIAIYHSALAGVALRRGWNRLTGG